MHLLMKLMKVIIIVAGSINFVKVEQHSISIVETNDILPTQVLTILEFKPRINLNYLYHSVAKHILCEFLKNRPKALLHREYSG